jgi:plasmid stabilization system protein ParE
VPTRYELTPEAKRDIRSIWLYTSEQWGERQADRYTALLENGMDRIARRRIVPRKFSARYPQVFVSRCEHHYIFYIHPDGKKPHILAVLHESMDVLTRLAERLAP